MKRDEGTYGKIGDKFDEYTEIVASRPEPVVQQRALPAQRPYVPEPHGADMSNKVFAAIGFGIGALILLLAILAFSTAAKWNGLGRDGAYVGYLLVGFFLTLAGVGGILSTWNHNFRVLAGKGGHSH